MIDPPVPVRCLERAVHLPTSETLVVADVHLGRGHETPVEAPIDGADEPVARIARLLETLDPTTLVVAGDLVHAFSGVSRHVEETLEGLLAAAARAGTELVVTPGNHDATLETALEVPLPEAHRTAAGAVVTHGHEPPAATGELYVVGHEHPAIRVDGGKRPCFLYGPSTAGNAPVLVLPAFSRLARGASVHRLGGSDRPPLAADASSLRPGVHDPEREETLWFPPLAECAHLL